MDVKVKLYKQILKNSFTVPVRIKYWNGEETITGDGGEPIAEVRIKESLKINPLKDDITLSLAEAYMDGKIEVDGSLQELMVSAFSNSESFVENKKYKILKLVNNHNKNISKEDIHRHYDIGNDFYAYWLDKSMTYSCAYFKKEGESLEEAQMNKIHHVLNKLRLKKGEELLDIGCGWGNLIITAAKEYGVKATGCTLSIEQFNHIKNRIKNENIEDMVEVKLIDYRDESKTGKQYDKISSIGMFEHVGKNNIGEYMNCVDKLLKSQGFALIHGISGQRDIDDDTCGYNSFLNKYIFPGGYIPSVAELIIPANKKGLKLIDLESLSRHYQLTLEEWHNRFKEHWDEIKLTKDDRFMRMWDIYLQSCAAVFESGQLDVCQYLFEKGTDNSRPLERNYMI